MLAPKRRNAPQWKMMMMIMMPATEHHFSVQCSVGLQRRRVARGGIGRSARVAVGRSVRRSERRSAFPCFSYFMIPKREWERIDYNDGHQATTIEQKKYGYLCMPHCRMPMPPPLQAEPYAGGTLVSQIDYSVRLFFFKIVSTLYRPLGITV